MDSRRGTARDGKKTVAEGSLTFDTFQSIFSAVVRDLNGSIIESEEDGGRDKKVVTVSLPEAARPVRVNLPYLHRTLDCGAPASEELCAEAVRSLLRELTAGEILPSIFDMPNKLMLIVETRNFKENFVSNGEFQFTRNFHENGEERPSSSSMDSECSSAPRAGSASEKEDQMVVQSFSCRSGELVKALILEMADYDLWITKKLLRRFGLSESRAFELAVKNLEEATPSPLESHFAVHGNQKDFEAVNRRLQQRNHDICFVKSSIWGPVYVWVRFEDQRTLSRLILPRFIESLSEAFGCGPTSTVVVPFSKYELYAGTCESFESMWFLGKYVLEKNKETIANPGSSNVSIRPYRVTKLRNHQGLVELEPYPVWGGTLGLRIFEGAVRKCLYPVPKTREESEILDPYKAADRAFVRELVEESLCFADVCWNCRKKPEGAQLLKCGKCQDVKYCSKECQTVSWRKDHKLECDTRKQTMSRTVKDGKKDKGAQKALKDHKKELRERLAQTIAENLRDVI